MKTKHLVAGRGLACGLVNSCSLRTNDIRKVDCYNCRRTKIYKEKRNIEKRNS
jgi:hypothetical protein